MRSFTRDGLVFDVIERGPEDGPAIVLLHGWPAGAGCWDQVAPALADAGFRTLVVDQRGYSPGAPPKGRRAYAMRELVADVVALLDAAGLEQVHLVGHDWGGAVAWALGGSHAHRFRSMTVLSTPHPRAMTRSLTSSTQLLRSSYMAFFQLPYLPEAVLLGRDARVFRSVLRRAGLSPDHVDAYVTRLQEPGALRASLAWYRALPFGGTAIGDCRVPTRFVWGSDDGALGRRAVDLTADHVAAGYRLDIVDGASHWLPEDHAEVVVAAVLDHVTAIDQQLGS